MTFSKPRIGKFKDVEGEVYRHLLVWGVKTLVSWLTYSLQPIHLSLRFSPSLRLSREAGHPVPWRRERVETKGVACVHSFGASPGAQMRRRSALVFPFPREHELLGFLLQVQEEDGVQLLVCAIIKGALGC